MPSFISAAVAALSLSSVASANVAYRRQELNFNSSSSSVIPSTSNSVPLGTAGTSNSVPLGTAGTSAISSTAGLNSTSSVATSTQSSSSSSTVPTAASTSTQTVGGVTFRIEVDIDYDGVTIDLDIITKRAGQTLSECLTTCAASTSCAGTAFDSNTDTCTFYRTIDAGSRRSAPGITFATVRDRAAVSSTAGTNGTASATGTNGTASATSTASATTSNNGTSVTTLPNNPGTNGTFPNDEDLICPVYNDEVLLNTDGSQYLINCGTNAQGTIIAVRKARMVRRQATFGNDWIVDCIDTCTAFGNCVATTYNSAVGTCTYYSAIEATFADADTDLAILVQDGTDATATASVPGAVVTVTSQGQEVTQTITTVPLTTSTVYGTTTRTISSCAPTVTNCPLQTVTEVVSLYTTVCPVSTAGAVGGAAGGAGGAVVTKTVCTACQYQASTVTVYQCPTLGATAGVPVPVTTKVISVPVLNGPTAPLTTSTVYSTSTGVSTGANGNKVTVTAVVSLYTTICPVSSGASTVPASNQPSVVVPGTTISATTVPGTTNGQTTVPGSTKPATTVPESTLKPSTSVATKSGSATTSGVVTYTGAASKNAGAGFAAALAGAAVFLL